MFSLFQKPRMNVRERERERERESKRDRETERERRCQETYKRKYGQKIFDLI
jgi:hypothetical protein